MLIRKDDMNIHVLSRSGFMVRKHILAFSLNQAERSILLFCTDIV